MPLKHIIIAFCIFLVGCATSTPKQAPIVIKKSSSSSEEQSISNQNRYQVRDQMISSLIQKYGLSEQTNVSSPSSSSGVITLNTDQKTVTPTKPNHNIAQENLQDLTPSYSMKNEESLKVEKKKALASPLHQKIEKEPSRIHKEKNKEEITEEPKENPVKNIEKDTQAKEEKPDPIEKSIEKKEKQYNSKSKDMIWPVKGKILQPYGELPDGSFNDGINIEAEEGTNVQAIDEGTVAYVTNQLKGFGNLVLIKHNSGWISAYAHLKNVCVEKGNHIQKAQTIGQVGKTGNIKTTQLHFELRKKTKSFNPLEILPEN